MANEQKSSSPHFFKTKKLIYKQLINKEVRDAYQQGVDYLNQFDHLYRVYIGARKSVFVGTSPGSCKCTIITTTNHTITLFQNMDNVAYCGEGILGNPAFNNAQCDELPGWPVFEWINKPSDGVVLAESAMNIPQATREPQPIEGSTHMALRNDNNLKIELNRIFNGEVGDFFKTAEQ